MANSFCGINDDDLYVDIIVDHSEVYFNKIINSKEEVITSPIISKIDDERKLQFNFSVDYNNTQEYQKNNSIIIENKHSDTNTPYIDNRDQGDNLISVKNNKKLTTPQSSQTLNTIEPEYIKNTDTVSISFNQRENTQNPYAIAIGNNAGENNQGLNAIAIGLHAGRSRQGSNSIAIGNKAGQVNMADNSIAIGYQAYATSKNTIVLNASGSLFNGGGITQGFYVNPVNIIRTPLVPENLKQLYFNIDTNEIVACNSA